MLIYFFIFSIVGFVIGKLQSNQQTAFIIIIAIAILWGISHKPIWGLVSFGELALGYFIATMTRK